MKHLIPTYIYVIIIALLIGGIFYTNSKVVPENIACTMDARICPDGTAVGRVAPKCEFAPCPIPQELDSTKHPLITLEEPARGDTVTSPVTVRGEARGNWFFEASFPITVVNWDGLIIGEGYATAQDDWMTTEYVPFTATIHYTLASGTPYARGTIILKKDNPSGLPAHDDAFEVPIIFSEITE